MNQPRTSFRALKFKIFGYGLLAMFFIIGLLKRLLL